MRSALLLSPARYALASVASGVTFCGFSRPVDDRGGLFASSGNLPCPRYSVPLRRRYRGTSAERSVRARMLMSDREVSTVAQLINNFVDLDFYDEDEEQEIFEFSVCRLVEDLAAALPNEVINLVHSELVLPAKHASGFERRMFAWLLARADLPFLDDTDQRHVIHCLMCLLLRSMCRPKGQVGTLSEIETHQLVLDVFVKGMIDVFDDPKQRELLVERIEAYVSAVPFFPTPLLEHMIDAFCSKATAVVTPIIVETYNEHLCRGDLYGEMALHVTEGVGLERKPFTNLLRENIIKSFTKPKKHRHRVSTVAAIFAMLPEARARSYVEPFVDSFLESLKTDKLERIMFNILLNDALQQGLIQNPVNTKSLSERFIGRRDDDGDSGGSLASLFQAKDGGARHHPRHR